METPVKSGGEITAPQKDNSIKTLLQRDDVKKRFEDMLGKKSNGFLVSVMTAVSQNKNLSSADPTSIMFAAATAASLDLPVNPNLGFAYLVPYNTKQADGSFRQMCQFQMGWRGFVQLCQRTGLFERINSTAVYEGQLIDSDPLKGNTYDWNAKSSDKVVGYVAYFKLLNGYEHELYMTTAEVQKHGNRYSKTFKSSYGVWKTNELEMSLKTVLKLLLSKYAPMSVEYLNKAAITDQAIVNDWEGEDLEYPDNENLISIKPDADQVSQEKQLTRLKKTLDEATDADDLEILQSTVGENSEMKAMVDARINELRNPTSDV